MRRTSSPVVAFLVLLLAPAAARAEDVAPVTSERGVDAFARILGEARRTGAVARVAGTHWFLLTRRFADDAGKSAGETRLLMTYDVAIDEGARVLRQDVVVRPEGRPGKVEIGYVVGLDGRVRSMRARTGTAVDARVEGKKLLVSVAGRAPDEHAWDDAILPKIVAAFLFPVLIGDGPARDVVFRDLNPFGELRPMTLRSIAAPAGQRAFGTFEGRKRESTRLFVKDGRLERFETDSEVNAAGVVTNLAVSERLTREKYDELDRTWQPKE